MYEAIVHGYVWTNRQLRSHTLDVVPRHISANYHPAIICWYPTTTTTMWSHPLANRSASGYLRKWIPRAGTCNPNNVFFYYLLKSKRHHADKLTTKFTLTYIVYTFIIGLVRKEFLDYSLFYLNLYYYNYCLVSASIDLHLNSRQFIKIRGLVLIGIQGMYFIRNT